MFIWSNVRTPRKTTPQKYFIKHLSSVQNFKHGFLPKILNDRSLTTIKLTRSFARLFYTIVKVGRFAHMIATVAIIS